MCHRTSMCLIVMEQENKLPRLYARLDPACYVYHKVTDLFRNVHIYLLNNFLKCRYVNDAYNDPSQAESKYICNISVNTVHCVKKIFL